MNEEGAVVRTAVLILFAACIFTAGVFAGIILGGGNIPRPVDAGSADRAVERELAECRRELDRERAITARLGGTIGAAREDIAAALDAGGRAADGVSDVIVKMERLLNMLRHIDRSLSDAVAGEMTMRGKYE